jgi:soluble lytic murein transglycosylase-like protein
LLVCSTAALAQPARNAKDTFDTQAMLAAVGGLYNIDPGLLAAIAQVESAWQFHAESPAGAMGLMQLMPATAKRFEVADPYNPIDSALGAARYIDALKHQYGNTPDALIKTLAAYNAGPGAVEHYGGIPPYNETQAYVRRVLWLYLTGTSPRAIVKPARSQVSHPAPAPPARAEQTGCSGSPTDVQILDELQTLKRARASAASR